MADYHIQDAKSTGGKAGRGRNKTSTVQVFEVIGDFGYLKKQIRFDVNDFQSHERAKEKARAWVAAQQQLQRTATAAAE